MNELYGTYLKCGGRVSTDSRTIKGGEMFVALTGENFDGNEYAADALAKGAAYAVVRCGSDAAASGDPRVKAVPDTLEALRGMAAEHRKTFKFPVIGLTGTSGKTTTKELMRAVLSQRFRTAATPGNFNNDIGVPLTILGISPEHTDMAIIEMGASHPEDISTLVEIVRPDYGLITNVGKAHLQGFGSFEGVRTAKGRLYDYLTAHGGKAFVNETDVIVQGMASERTGMEQIPYSVQAEVEPPTAECPCLTMDIEGYGLLHTHMTGGYNAANVCAAIAVGTHFGIPLREAAEAIASYRPDSSRSQLVRTGANTLIADCYNANPGSMSAALDNLAALNAAHKVALLGDMRELGEESLKEHVAIARKAIAGDYVSYFVGAEFAAALSAISGVPDLGVNGSPLSPRTFADADSLAAYLLEHPISEATILIKGSHSMRMEKLLQVL